MRRRAKGPSGIHRWGLLLVVIWWSVRNQGRTLFVIRYNTFKVFFYLVQQNIVQNDGPLSTVEKQGHPVIVEIDCPEKDVDDSAPGIFIVYISALERIQE